MSKVVSAVLNPISSVLSYFGNNKADNSATNQVVSGNQNAQAALQPYMDTGIQANTALQNALSGGTLGGNFTPGDLTQEPGYQFTLDQGNQAIDRKNAATGGYFSGGALKQAQQFGEGLASTTYGDAFNRWLQSQQNTYNVLSGQQKQGQTAATNYGGFATNIGSEEAQNTIAKQNNKNNALSSFI